MKIAKTYLDLLPEDILKLIYKKLFHSIIKSREFQLQQAWMYYRVMKRRNHHSRFHYTNYIGYGEFEE